MRYTDADLLRKNMAELQEYEHKYLLTHEVFNTIWNTPMADVRENVHGEWIEWQKCTPFYTQDLYKCSKCNESYLKELVYFLGNLQYRFCPNCGADMRGADNE